MIGQNLSLDFLVPLTLEEFGSKKWCDLISENWYVELLCRRRIYTKPYMQKDENIIWIENTLFQAWIDFLN